MARFFLLGIQNLRYALFHAMLCSPGNPAHNPTHPRPAHRLAARQPSPRRLHPPRHKSLPSPASLHPHLHPPHPLRRLQRLPRRPRNLYLFLRSSRPAPHRLRQPGRPAASAAVKVRTPRYGWWTPLAVASTSSPRLSKASRAGASPFSPTSATASTTSSRHGT
jgi:hypothetical protein